MKQRPRFPPRQKRPDGTFGCRGCGGDIPKGRLTWCSHKCHEQFDPFYVKQTVWKRCSGRCEKCGKDCSKAAQRAHQEQKPKPPDYRADCKLDFPYHYKAYYEHPAYKEYLANCKKWRSQKPAPEYDHITPHCEGGKFTPENIRLLCVLCHKERTATWRKERVKH